MFSVDRFNGSQQEGEKLSEVKDAVAASTAPSSSLLSKLAAKVSARKRSRAEIGGDSPSGSLKYSDYVDAANDAENEDEPSRKRAAVEAAAAKTAVAAIGSALRSSVDLQAATRRGFVRSGALASSGTGNIRSKVSQAPAVALEYSSTSTALAQQELRSSVLTPVRKMVALPKLAESVAAHSSMVSCLSEDEAGVKSLGGFGVHQKLCGNVGGLIADAPLFPVQAHGVPALMHAHRASDPGVRTVCLVAPTGSGKTLAFALPVVQGLLGRTVPRLRALVILPTRDLAMQVHRVFRALCQGTSLRVAAAVGQSDFGRERSMLSQAGGAERLAGVSVAAQLALGLIKAPLGATSDGATKPFGPAATDEEGELLPLAGSPPDILICTPGRLVDHLEETPGFTLEHLQFLVLDEADRLLGSAGSVRTGWLAKLRHALRRLPKHAAGTGGDRDDEESVYGLGAGNRGWGSSVGHADTTRVGGMASSLGLPAGLFGRDMRWAVGSDEAEGSSRSGVASSAAARRAGGPPGLVRILCSATMTSDPMRMAALGVGDVLVIPPPGLESGSRADLERAAGSVTTLSQVPRRLRESVAVCKGGEKPLMLALELLRLWRLGKQALVFAGSVDGAHRLTRLLQLMRVPPPARESPAFEGLAVPIDGEVPGRAFASKPMEDGAPTGEESSSSSSSSSSMELSEDGQDWDPDAAEAATQSAGTGEGGATVAEQSVFEYSSGMPQGTRQRLLRLAAEGFAACPVLVCTDAASRGLDMPKLEAVIYYDPPAAAQAYVHRVGRTARARRAGEALTLCSPTEMRRFLGGRAMAGEFVLLSGEGRTADGSAINVEAAERAEAEASKRAAGRGMKDIAAGKSAAAARKAAQLARRAKSQDEAIGRGAKPMVRIDASASAWAPLVPAYERGLRALRPLVEAEEGGRLRVWDAPPSQMVAGELAQGDLDAAGATWSAHRDAVGLVLAAAGGYDVEGVNGEDEVNETAGAATSNSGNNVSTGATGILGNTEQGSAGRTAMADCNSIDVLEKEGKSKKDKKKKKDKKRAKKSKSGST